MSEFKLFYRENGRLRISKDIQTLKSVQKEDILWIDLNDVEVEVESELEQFLKIYIQEEEEMEEIEISTRYIQTEDSMVANSHFLLDNYSVEAVSFIVKSSILVSVRDAQLKSFDETLRKIFANQRNFPTGYHVLVALFETRVEY
ncbi:MAG: magnesium and cobalt transport protein CorA, partial [Bacteroidales bacterium]|nr:magnesium and cobalt transport protein CorA [Bacteroidales bacterium]